MRRREFILLLGGVATSPLSARAQQPQEKVWRLAMLAVVDDPWPRDFVLAELRRRGFVHGRNLDVVVRTGTAVQMPQLVRELLAAKPDVIVAISDWAVHPVKQASDVVPIVACPMGADPVAVGLAASWARPGGNITGVSLTAPELEIKRLDLLRQAVPNAHRIATLATHREITEPGLAPVRAVAAKAEIQLMEFYVDGANEYKGAFAAMRAAGAEAVVILPTPELFHDAKELATIALESGLPSICGDRRDAEQGCLIGYGPNFTELVRRAADDIVRIFQGAQPAELPFVGPTRFESTINLRTARTLGLTLPPSLLLSVDEVIE
jgi:putative ABC transport system substrate-binding protein